MQYSAANTKQQQRDD